MIDELLWSGSSSVSCLHVAEALGDGNRLADGRLAETMAEPATQLNDLIARSQMPRDRFWAHLTPLAASIPSNRHLAETTLAKVVGRGSRSSILAAPLEGCLTDLENAMRRALPKLEDELALRRRPMRAQWEERGPGLLRRLSLLTDPDILPGRADIILVHPAFGGGGRAHMPYNSVRLEAVLANPHPELTEVLRLGWLLGQLHVSLPRFSEAIHADRLPDIAELALAPAILSAGKSVGLVDDDPNLLEKMLRAWRIGAPPDVDAVEVLTTWWETHQETEADWRVSLTALDRMLG